MARGRSTMIFARPFFQGDMCQNQGEHIKGVPSLKLTFSHLKIDSWNTSFLFGWPIFRCYVSGRVTGMLTSLTKVVIKEPGAHLVKK